MRGEGNFVGHCRIQVGYPSGQREQTVNLPAHAFEGSNPSPTITERDSRVGGEFERPRAGVRVRSWERDGLRRAGFAGVAQLVERKPSKLDVAGSSPVSRSEGRTTSARVAQSVEHPLGKGEVIGSIPIACFF